MKFQKPVLVLSALLFSFFAHAEGQATTTAAPTANENQAHTAQPSAQMTSMSDAEIAEIMKVANDAEVDAAKVAEKRAKNSEVKDFAKHMISEHKENMKDEKNLLKKENLKAESNDVAKTMKKDAKDKIASLKKAKGNAFEKAYIEQQISMHRQLMQDLDQKLIPAAQNPQFKQYLQTTRDHVQKHLSQAEQINSTLTK